MIKINILHPFVLIFANVFVNKACCTAGQKPETKLHSHRIVFLKCSVTQFYIQYFSFNRVKKSLCFLDISQKVGNHFIQNFKSWCPLT